METDLIVSVHCIDGHVIGSKSRHIPDHNQNDSFPLKRIIPKLCGDCNLASTTFNLLSASASNIVRELLVLVASVRRCRRL